MDGEATRGLIRDNLSRVRFEIVRITNLETNAAKQSRRGTATFSAFFKGTADTSMASMNFGSVNSIWSLGLQETEPGVWKVNRITPVQIPGDGLYIPGGRRQGPSVMRARRRRDVAPDARDVCIVPSRFVGEPGGPPRPAGREASAHLRSGYSRMMSLCWFAS